MVPFQMPALRLFSPYLLECFFLHELGARLIVFLSISTITIMLWNFHVPDPLVIIQQLLWSPLLRTLDFILIVLQVPICR